MKKEHFFVAAEQDGTMFPRSASSQVVLPLKQPLLLLPSFHPSKKKTKSLLAAWKLKQPYLCGCHNCRYLQKEWVEDVSHPSCYTFSSTWFLSSCVLWRNTEGLSWIEKRWMVIAVVWRNFGKKKRSEEVRIEQKATRVNLQKGFVSQTSDSGVSQQLRGWDLARPAHQCQAWRTYSVGNENETFWIKIIRTNWWKELTNWWSPRIQEDFYRF